MRIALVTRHADPRFTPLALLYLKAALVDRAAIAAADVTILELAPEAPANEIAAAICRAAPEVLALSCYCWNVGDLMQAAAVVKQRDPSIRVVVGGPEVGPIGRRVLEKYPAPDLVVKSEGEGPIAELVERWRDGRAIDDVRGIWRRGAGGPVEHSDAPIVEDLNQLPSPHARRYLDPTQRIACVETQRGCVFRCSFCFYSKDVAIGNRRFDLDRVKAELEFWLEQDILQLYLMDPVFNLGATRAKEICRFLIARNRHRIPLHAEISAELVDDELAALMKAAHFELLEVGLQTIEAAALATIGRRLKLQPFLDGVRRLREHDLPFELQLILGLPGDTPESHRESLNFAASLAPEYLASFTLRVLPGTELWRKAELHGLSFDPEPGHLVRSTPTMSSDFIARRHALNPWVRRLWNSGAIRWLSREPGLCFADLVERWGSWCDRNRVGDDEGEVQSQLGEFVSAECAAHGIRSDFHRGFTRAELDPCVQMLRRIQRRDRP